MAISVIFGQRDPVSIAQITMIITIKKGPISQWTEITMKFDKYRIEYVPRFNVVFIFRKFMVVNIKPFLLATL